MTEHEIQALRPAFADFLGQFRECFRHDRTAAHFDTYCRGLLSDLPRKSVEPIALAAGTAVRTLQLFLSTAKWDHDRARALLQQHLATVLADHPADPLGRVGVIDETSCAKWGDQTPGVQRQYLGCLGKIDNGIVTVHVGVATGSFQALLDVDLYLPESWAADRDRCREAGIPDTVRYRSKWRIALDQLIRLHRHGVTFDWLVFDEGYGGKAPFLWALDLAGQRFVAEVPVNFAARTDGSGPSRRVDQVLTTADATQGERFELRRTTTRNATWRAVDRTVRVRDRTYRVIAAINEATAEVKYFVTNATAAPLSTVVAVAFRRATIEHAFRRAKQEAGLMHFEGRQYVGLIRHLTLTTIVLGFVAIHTEQMRGEKSAGHAGAGLPGVKRRMRDLVPTPPGDPERAARRPRDPIPSAA
jgi:SRSO17 transposase